MSSLHPCACGCGEQVTGTYKRGHWARAQKQASSAPLPDPGENLDELVDLAELVPDDADEGDGTDLPPDDAIDVEDVVPDKPPGRLSEPKDRSRPRTGKTRVTQAVRKDVEAKIRFILNPAAMAWQVRDRYCGSAAVQQEPAVSSALAEIVCDSPDILNWFTGPVGGYMKWFRLAMAVWPVGMAVRVHHLAHAEVFPADAQQPPQAPAWAA
jgi:hypothetical protein